MDRRWWSNSENEEVRCKDRCRLSPSQGSSLSPLQGLSLSESIARIVLESIARIVAVWVHCKEPSLSENDGSSTMDRRKDGSSQGLLLTELHRQWFELHRWWLRSTMTMGDQQWRWFGFGSLIAVWVFVLFFLLTALSEMFVNWLWNVLTLWT